MWKNSKNKITNTIVTAIIAFLLAFGFTSYNPEAKEDKSDNNTSVSDEVTTMPKKTTITTTTTSTTTSTTTETTTTIVTTTESITEPPTEPPTPAPTEAPYVPPVQSNQHDYVLNTDSMKFHYPNCPSAKKINPENRSETYATRDEVLSWGYSPCGRCDP